MLKRKKIASLVLGTCLGLNLVGGGFIRFGAVSVNADTSVSVQESISSDFLVWGEDTECTWDNTNRCYVNNVRFKLIDEANKEVSITAYDFRSTIGYYNVKGDVVLPEKIKVDGEYYTVTTIEDGSLSACDYITSFTVPKTVTNMKLYSKGNLEAIYVDKDNPVYSDDNGVLYNKDKTTLIKYPLNKEGTSYSIPTSVTKIEDNAFEYNRFLSDINVPYTVKEIGKAAFNGCTSLASIYIPYGVTEIKPYTFEACVALDNVNIPSSVTSIGDSAFYICKNLKNISFSNNLKSIGEYAFYADENLENIYLPDSIESIGSYAFESCEGLKNIKLPKNLLNICGNAFAECPSLENIYVDNENINYTSVDGILYSKDMTRLVKYPAGKSAESYYAPATLTSVDEYAFDSCEDLNKVGVPEIE